VPASYRLLAVVEYLNRGTSFICITVWVFCDITTAGTPKSRITSPGVPTSQPIHEPCMGHDYEPVPSTSRLHDLFAEDPDIVRTPLRSSN
jgi:hypothetical protein